MNIEELKTRRASNYRVGLNFNHIFSKEEIDFYIYSIIEENKNGKSITKLCKEYQIGKNVVFKHFKTKQYFPPNRQNVLTVREDLFESVNTEEDAYWLGFLYADGCIDDRGRVSFKLQRLDKPHLEKFAKFTHFTNIVHDYISKCGGKSFEACGMSFAAQHLHKNFIRLGVVPRKSLILKFPTFEQVPEHLMIHFIRGYFDGDGHIKNRENCISFTLLGTYEFLKGLVKFLKLSDNDFLWRKDKRHSGNTHSIHIKTQKSLEIFHSMYDNAIIYLDRKKQKFEEILLKRRNNKYCKTIDAKILKNEV